MATYGLIGRTLSHSFSKAYFTAKWLRENSDNVYENFELSSIDALLSLLTSRRDIIGLNVTLPYKKVVVPYLNAISKDAERSGAVNTLKITHNSAALFIQGFNTDIIGFQQSVTPLLDDHGKKAIILGSGGASDAVVVALQHLSVDFYRISREPREGFLPYQAINKEIMDESYMVVNCTPVGMYPLSTECPGFPYFLFTEKHLAYDLIYNPEETVFMKRAAANNARTKNGLEMLELQAEASWKIWNS